MIQLTLRTNGERVLVNPAQIAAVLERSDGAIVCTAANKSTGDGGLHLYVAEDFDSVSSVLSGFRR